MKLFLPLLAATIVIALNSAIDALNVKLSGINYTAANGVDSLPRNQRCKNATQVQNDMHLLSALADKVRIYSIAGCDLGVNILPAAKAAGIKVHLGIWTTNNHTQLLKEKNALASLIDSGLYDDNVVGLFVGSEAIYRKDVTADLAISYMNEIRDYLHSRNIKTPVTIADTLGSYYDNPQLFDAVDYVSVNTFSFWVDADITEGGGVALDGLKNMRIACAKSGKKLLIGETGWSSGGSSPGASVATPENQASYFSDWYQIAHSRNMDYYWSVAFDSLWRIANGDNAVEAHFGVLNEDGTMKSNFQQLVVPNYPPKGISNAAINLYLSGDNSTLFMTSESNDLIVSEEQVWFFDTTTQQVRSKSSDRCLEADQDSNGCTVRVYRCISSEGNQKWTYNSVTRQMLSAGNLGFCLDVDPAQNNLVQLNKCSPTDQHQQWSVIAQY